MMPDRTSHNVAENAVRFRRWHDTTAAFRRDFKLSSPDTLSFGVAVLILTTLRGIQDQIPKTTATSPTPTRSCHKLKRNLNRPRAGVVPSTMDMVDEFPKRRCRLVLTLQAASYSMEM
jgi:hypothetical protein